MVFLIDVENFVGLTCALVIQKHNLRVSIASEIVDYVEREWPGRWYWRLIEKSGLDEMLACELTIAMHVDVGLTFDYKACITTPNTP